MPLTQFQRAVIGVLHEFRTPHDYVGGGAALNFDELRLSDDMDMFQDRTDALRAGVRKELDALRARGFAVEVLYTNDDMAEAIVRRDGSETRVQ